MTDALCHTHLIAISDSLIELQETCGRELKLNQVNKHASYHYQYSDPMMYMRS